jgi:outer membrane biosynthesis protein TonB
MFDDAAIATIKTWETRPATRDGKPVPVCITIEMAWHLY